MALQEFLVEGRNGGRCVPYKILNEQVPQFQQVATSKGVLTEKRGKGRDSSTIYVCSVDSRDLNPLKEFIRNGIPIFVAEENNDTPQQTAA